MLRCTGRHAEANAVKERIPMRRTAVLLLSTVVVFGSLLAGGGIFAAAQDTGFAGHPVVGSWMLDTDIEDPENLPSLVRFSADGGYIEIEADGNALGSWEPTGDSTATLTFSFADEEGVATIRASVEVAPDGQSLSATYTLEFVDPSGQSSGEIGPGTAEGTRMVVEVPGTPVMSFEEFYGQFEGTPEATPAS
jgi:hypothetical protein